MMKNKLVPGLIEVADPAKPTKAERLSAALAMKDEASGFYSMEIMVGRRVSSDENMGRSFAGLRFLNARLLANGDEREWRIFLEGFPYTGPAK